MPPQSRNVHGGGTRGRTLLFGGIAVVCCVVYSTFTVFSASRPPPVYRPHESITSSSSCWCSLTGVTAAWSATGTTLYKSQADSKASPSVQEVDEQEVLLDMIRNFLSRSSGDKVDSLRYQLHNILDESTQQDSAKETEATGRGDSAQRLRKQTTGSAGLEGKASSRPGKDSESETDAREEGGLDKAEGTRQKEEEEHGVDLLWWMDSKHRAKTADEEEADRDADYTVKCRKWKAQHKVVPGVSWGDLPHELQEEWKSVNCDEYLVEVKAIVPSVDCTASDVDEEGLPLVAIMAAATTRNVKNIKLRKLALFRHLMPSIVRTVECGFRYLMVVGYDLGDPFYDSKDGQRQVHAWFEENIQAQLSPVNIKIELLLVAVDNTLQKPGPVFLEMARAAYKQGVDFFYRVNDDTEMLNPWVSKFVASLEDMGFPYGAVGPLCRQGNTKILTHDFTHRTHMEIFDGEYYPPQLTDWWMDDWIARTYGSSRTRQSKTVEVIHHTGAHGQRYHVDPTHQNLLDGLVHKGRDRIYAYMQDNGVDQDEMARFKGSRFDKFPLEDIAVAAVARKE